jgi:hypothetical protein
MLNKNSKRTYVGDFTAKERKNETKLKKKAELWFLIPVKKQRMGIRNLSKPRLLRRT